MRTTRTLASLALAAYLALVSTGGRDVVLCVGTDGHLAIELGCLGDSCSSPALPGPGASAGQCGACVDTPLLKDAAHVATVRSGNLVVDTTLASSAEIALPAVRPPVVADSCPYRPPSAVLRTTVLLI